MADALAAFKRLLSKRNLYFVQALGPAGGWSDNRLVWLADGEGRPFAPDLVQL